MLLIKIVLIGSLITALTKVFKFQQETPTYMKWAQVLDVSLYLGALYYAFNL